MPRIQPLKKNDAQGKSKELYDTVQKKLGGVPNILATMAKSPPTLKSYLDLSSNLGEGTFSAELREQIALAVAGVNACGYCASAHTAIGKGAGLSDDQTTKALQGEADDPKAQAAIDLAKTITESRGNVTDNDVKKFLDAGYDEAQLLELITIVALNIFTNYFNHIVQTDIDFPEVKLPQHAGA